MKYLFSVILLQLSISVFSQEHPAPDFFEPYKYPKHYSFDGAFKILELAVFMPMESAGYGATLKMDFSSFRLGTDAVRLNLGFGFGYNTTSDEIRFTSTPLANGGFGENYLNDGYQITNFHLYPRLWIRALNPLNFSIAAGPVAFIKTRITKSHFSVYDNTAWENGEHVVELASKNTEPGFGYFIEAKAMLNFKNWGISGGVSKYSFDDTSTLQPTMGLWFGLHRLTPVVN